MNNINDYLPKFPNESHLKLNRPDTKNPTSENLKKKIEELRQQLLYPTNGVDIIQLEEAIGLEIHRELFTQGELPVSHEELDRFGPKHKDLVLTTHYLSTLSIPGVKVPSLQGVSTDLIEDFLKQNAPQVFEHWTALGKLYASYLTRPSDQDRPFLELPAAADHLEAIHHAIASVFANNSIELPAEVQQWLAECKEMGHYLMVRSSGAEDSSAAANAGGNVSIPYVLPEEGPLSLAMGQVVASYFSYASLQNRINAKTNPFIEDLKIGLTTQELIGERIGGEKDPKNIPVSLVLFSNEPLYVGNEKFRVMRLSAAFGHGNGVVGAEGIPTDTYLIVVSEANPSKLYVLSDIQDKNVRLAPIEVQNGIELQKLDNPREISKKPALTDEMLARLYHWGVICEKCSGSPRDMELVIKNDTIYHVQGRSINRPEQLPTYLDMRKVHELNNSPLGEVLQAEMIVPGRASVVVASHPRDILDADNLKQAESEYNKAKPKLVVVHTPEPANSHPVVNFSEMGVPCLYFADKKRLNQMLDEVDQDRPLVICMQNGTISEWDALQASPESCISEGYAVHPAKIAMTIGVGIPRGAKPAEVPQEVKNLLLDIRSSSTNALVLEKLEALKSHSWVTGLENRANDLKGRVIPLQGQKYSHGIDTITSAVQSAFDELHASLKRPDGERLRPLFHAKVLETALTGTGCSIVNIEPFAKGIDELIDYQNQLAYPAHLSDLLLDGMGVLPEEYAEEWKKFLLLLEPHVESKKISEETVKQFKDFISQLHDWNMLSTWMILFFNQDTGGIGLSIVLNKILKEHADVIDIIKELKSRHEDIQQMSRQLDLFGSPKTFEGAWNRLQNLTNTFFHDQLNISNDASPMAKLALYRSMGELVDLFDSSIKTMKASQEFPDYKKTELLKKMLTDSFKLMADWAIHMVPEGAIPIKERSSLHENLSEIHSILKKTTGLHASPNFSVTAAAFGSVTLFERHKPKTLEDVFTLIHQNLLFTVSCLNNFNITEKVLEETFLPLPIDEAIQQMATMGSQYPIRDGNSRCFPSRSGINLDSNGSVNVKYNIPLRLHGGTIEFHYDQNTDQLTMRGSLLGEARERWEHSKMLIEGLDGCNILNLSEPVRITEQEITFSWILPYEESLASALEEYAAMANYSMLQGGYVKLNELIFPLITRCELKGKKNELIQYLLENPTPLLQGIYKKYLDETLPQEHPERIPISALLYSLTTPPAFVDEMIAAWAKTPGMACGDFFDQYRLSGKIKPSDEAFIHRFMPPDNDPGFDTILSKIKHYMAHSGEWQDREVMTRTIEAYLSHVKNPRALIKLIKNSYVKHEWNEIFSNIIGKCDQPDGLIRYHSIIKEAGLDETVAMASLVQKGLMLEEAWEYCRSKPFNERMKPLLKAFHDLGKVSEVAALCNSPKVLEDTKQDVLSTLKKLKADPFILKELDAMDYRLLFDDNAVDDLIFRAAMRIDPSTSDAFSKEIKRQFVIGLHREDSKEIFKILGKFLKKDQEPELLSAILSIAERKLESTPIHQWHDQIDADFYRDLYQFAIERNLGVELAGKFALGCINNGLERLDQVKEPSSPSTGQARRPPRPRFNAKAPVGPPSPSKYMGLGVSLTESLLKAGKGQDVGLKAFEMLHDSRKTPQNTLKMAAALVNQGIEIDLALQEVTDLLKNQGLDEPIYEAAFDLVSCLLDHGKGADLVNEAPLLLGGNSPARETLIKSLLRNGMPLPAAFEEDINKNFIKYAKTLVENGRSVDLAIDYVKRNRDYQACQLAVTLVKKGSGLKEAIKLARACQGHSDWRMREVGFDIFLALAEKGPYQKESAVEVHKALFDLNSNIREKAYRQSNLTI